MNLDTGGLGDGLTGVYGGGGGLACGGKGAGAVGVFGLLLAALARRRED